MKLTRFLMPALLLVGIGVTARAQESTEPETITYNVNCDEGGLTGSGNYRSTWTSSETEAGITVTSHRGPSGGSPANNFENTASGNLKLNAGNVQGATEVIIECLKTGKWYISHYAFKAAVTTSNTSLSLAVQGGEAKALVPGVDFVVDQTLTKGDVAHFVLAGDNGHPVELKDFTVTITLDPEYVAPPYELPVEADLIVNGKFDEWTTWYDLQLGVNGYKLYNNGGDKMQFSASDKDIFEDDSHLWAFVVADEEAHTVKIYNKASGVSKVLGCPKTGSDLPCMVDDTSDNYTTWNVTTAETKKDGTAISNSFNGKRTIYITRSDNDQKVLNCFGGVNGYLNYWPNYDDNSVIVPIVVESKFPVDMAHGYLRRTGNNVSPNNRWQAIWTYGGAMNIKFETGFNNMTISEWGNPENVDEHPEAWLQLASSMGANTFTFTLPDEYYISAFSVDVYCPHSDGKTSLRITSSHEDGIQDIEMMLNGTQTHHIEMSDLPHTYIPQFITTGENYEENNVVLENFTATIRRYIRKYEPAINVYPRNTVSRQIRIPAITTVGAGEHAGRLITAYDFRWCNADLGAGNIDLTIATSDDNGQTWTAPGFAMDADGNPVTEYNHNWTKGDNWADVQSNATEAWDAAWGDAALCADRESQTVMMIAVGGPTGFWGSRRNNPQSAIRWISHDGGTTWSAPQNITEKIYSLFDGEPRNGKIDGMFFGSGRAMQSRYIKVGDYYRVYSVISSQNGGGSTRNWVLYTDDMGETWDILGSYDQCPVPSTADEPKAEELPDGSVLLAARRYGGNRNFNIFRYTNPTTGEGKWIGDHFGTNMGMGAINACDGEIYLLPAERLATGEKCFIALQSFPYGGGRQNVSIAWKRLDSGEDFDKANDFAIWGGRYQVCAGDAAYSTMSLMNDGHIGFFYEMCLTNGANYDGVFKDLTLELITDGQYAFYPDHENAIAQALTQSLVEYRMATAPAEKADAMTEAGNAYLAEPTYANYIKFNRAEYGEPAAEADEYDFPYEDVALWPGAETAAPLEVTPATLVIKVGDTAHLSVATSKEVTWSSSNELVATVENGVVTAISEGNAIITASTDTKSATCAVTVEAKEGAVSIEEISGEGVDSIFDLQGRRLFNPGRGLYIINGQLRQTK